VQDAACVREADPALFEEVLAGRIPANKAAARVRRARRHAEIPAAPPLPTGPFDLILADPPWQMGSPDSPSAPENHYPTMSLEELAGLAVPAAGDAVLYLWAVNMLLPEAMWLMGEWGFAYRANLVWVKDWIGQGVWARQRHELVLVGTRGSARPPEPTDRPDSVIEAPRGRHSQKPDALYERIERAYPYATKCELFARGVPRSGWVAWGNEVEAA
jgi:N6-adenosine-specific RNA methylase IME4